MIKAASRAAIGWELYRSFLGVLQEGSLSGAARALGVAQPTVGRHVTALEQALGQLLFTRSQVGLLPTEAALALRGYAEAMASTAAALERAAASQGEGVQGTVRITASEVVGVEVLPPLLMRLRERHPALKIELALSNKVQDLLQREADIAVRMTEPRQDQLLARHVGSIELGLHAHRDYLARHGEPASLADLQQGRHTLIGFDQVSAFIRRVGKALPGFEREAFSLRSDSDLAQLALLRAGAGIGVCQLGIGRRESALQRVLAAQFAFALPTWVTMHEDLRHSPRCRATFDALVEGLGAYIATSEAHDG